VTLRHQRYERHQTSFGQKQWGAKEIPIEVKFELNHVRWMYYEHL
jgi:hypothetical protein